MLREPAVAQEPGERAELRRCIARRLHDRADPLAEALVRVAHDCHRPHPGAGGEGVLDGNRGDVHPAPDDEVLHPAGDPEVPVAVDAGEVAGAEEPVRGQERLVEGRLAVIADEHPRPPHRELALGARGGFFAVRVEGSELEPGEPDARRRQHLLGGAFGRAGREPALGHAPEHGDPGVRELGLRLLHERRGDLGAAAQEPGEGAKLRPAGGGGRGGGRPRRIHEVLEEGRRGGGEAAAVGGDGVEGARGVPPVLEDEGGAGVQRESGAVDRPDAVPEGGGHEDRRVGAEPETLRERDVEGRERVAGVHDRLREPGGAGGEHEVVEALGRVGGGGVASAGFPARFRSRSRPRPAPGPVAAGDRHRGREGAVPRGRDGKLPGLGPAVPFDGEDRPRPAELGRVAKGGLVGADRQVGGDGTPAEHGEHRHHPLRPVRHEDEDDVARPDPLLRELGTEAAGFTPELFAAETPPPIVDHRKRRRALPHEALESVRERHARPPAALAVAARALRAHVRLFRAGRSVHPATPARRTALSPGPSRSNGPRRCPRNPRPGSTGSPRWPGPSRG